MLDTLSKARQGATDTKGPDPVKVKMGGNSYLKPSFPALDYVTIATLLQ